MCNFLDPTHYQTKNVLFVYCWYQIYVLICSHQVLFIFLRLSCDAVVAVVVSQRGRGIVWMETRHCPRYCHYCWRRKHRLRLLMSRKQNNLKYIIRPLQEHILLAYWMTTAYENSKKVKVNKPRPEWPCIASLGNHRSILIMSKMEHWIKLAMTVFHPA